MKPGPAISARSKCAGRSRSSSTTIFAATSRGDMPNGLASWSATFVVKSPWPGSLGAVSAIPPGGAGNPAATSAPSTAPSN